jgi:hypothetical protein
LSVDDACLESAGVIWLNPVRHLQYFLDRDVNVGEGPLLQEFHRARAVSAAVMCGTWITVFSTRWLSKTSPQGHLIKELGLCDGSLSPRSHMAYFRAVQSLSSRHA